MSNWEKQQSEKNEAKEKIRSRKDALAKYFFDLSKLTFTALVLGGILSFFQGEAFSMTLGLMIVFGIIAAIFLARIGNNILK